VRALAAFVVVAAGCGPVQPASDRVPVSGGQSTTQGDEGTKPGSDAPMHGDDAAAGDDMKLDIDSVGETLGGCPHMFDMTPLPSALEVLVDVSQTMATQYVDHDGMPETQSITRWHMLSAALTEWLPALADGADIDLQIFPRVDAPPPPATGACQATVGFGLGTPVDTLLALLPAPEATFMQGANPTELAIATAQFRLQDIDEQATRTIVLFTDGAPNCAAGQEPPALFDAVADATRGWAEYAFALGIRTYVVAIAVPDGEYGGSQGDPYANHHQILQGIANAGGTPYLPVADAAELETMLAYIVAQTRSCRAAIPSGLAGAVGWVEVDGQTFYEIGFGNCFGDAGFVWVDNGLYDTIELCGTACELFVEEGTATLVEQCAFPE